MTQEMLAHGFKAVMGLDGLQRLIEVLGRQGYTVVGPRVRDGAIVYEHVSGVDDLPSGWTDEQAPGHYRLRRRDDEALFGYAVGPHSVKEFLFPPTQTLWRASRVDSEITFEPAEAAQTKYAFIGVRACELAAVAVQDRVFLEGKYVDSDYQARREQAVFIAVNCGVAAATCFCTSMGTGPRAHTGYDLSMTELLDGARHEFVVEVGTERGAALLAAIDHREAAESDIDAAALVVEATTAAITRTMPTDGLHELLTRNAEHPRWAETAGRCMTCGNCTSVCPTCFCSTVTDATSLDGTSAERAREWDSCFTLDFSYVHGNVVRSSPPARYRQWMTHKLSTWHDQFGTSGCIGCGRCISWCPVGIDITEEAEVIRRTDGVARKEAPGGTARA